MGKTTGFVANFLGVLVTAFGVISFSASGDVFIGMILLLVGLLILAIKEEIDE
jgi:hypothetical protein